MHQSRSSVISNDPQFNHRQQWAILNDYRALEIEKARSVEKQILQHKKQQFKQQLDQQLLSKHSMGRAEKDEDRKYYQFITMKAQEMKQKQQRQKFEKYLKRKQIEQQNQLIQPIDPRQADRGKVYNIEFGLKSQIQKKRRAEQIRKDVNHTLDWQLQEKHQRQKRQRQEEIQQFNRNQEYQRKMFNERNKGKHNYHQNEKVYDHYRELYKQKMWKDRQLEHKFVDQVVEKNNQEAEKKKQREAINKHKLNVQMKDSLEKHMQLQNATRNDDLKTNPQDATYSFMSGVFKDHKKHYDKQEYSMILDRQVVEQKRNKMQHKFMSEEEYRLNANQLNKALKGNYTFDKYHDRSLGTIGNRVSVPDINTLKGHDADAVRNRLQEIRGHERNASALHNRSHNDLQL